MAAEGLREIALERTPCRPLVFRGRELWRWEGKGRGDYPTALTLYEAATGHSEIPTLYVLHLRKEEPEWLSSQAVSYHVFLFGDLEVVAIFLEREVPNAEDPFRQALGAEEEW